jgi:hypothetical protein
VDIREHEGEIPRPNPKPYSNPNPNPNSNPYPKSTPYSTLTIVIEDLLATRDANPCTVCANSTTTIRVSVRVRVRIRVRIKRGNDSLVRIRVGIRIMIDFFLLYVFFFTEPIVLVISQFNLAVKFESR